MPAVTGLVTQTVDRGSFQQANALRSMASSMGGIAGPVVAGVLVATVNAGAALAVDTATFAVSALALGALRLATTERAQEQSLRRDLREGWHEFSSRTWLVAANVIAALANVTVLAPLFVLGPA